MKVLVQGVTNRSFFEGKYIEFSKIRPYLRTDSKSKKVFVFELSRLSKKQVKEVLESNYDITILSKKFMPKEFTNQFDKVIYMYDKIPEEKEELYKWLLKQNLNSFIYNLFSIPKNVFKFEGFPLYFGNKKYICGWLAYRNLFIKRKKDFEIKSRREKVVKAKPKIVKDVKTKSLGDFI